MEARRVLMIAPHFPPMTSAGVFRTVRFVKYLPDYGWEPLILTGEAPVNGGAAADSSGQPFFEDLVVERVGPWSFATRSRPQRPSSQQGRDKGPSTSPEAAPAAKPRWRRLAGNLRALLSETPDKNICWVPPSVLRGLRLVRKHRPEVIYTSGPPHSVQLVGYLLKRLTRRPWVADFRDPWARLPWGVKPHNPWGQRLDPRLERVCMKAADRVILNTENMADDFRAYYSRLGPEKFSAIPNGCDPDVVPVIDRLIADQPNRGGNGTIRICHPGSLYRKRDPRPIVDAVRELAQDGVHVVLEQIGNRALGFDLPTYVEQRGLTAQVTLEEHLPHEQVLRRMARADVLMVIQPGTPTQVPGKLFEMLLFKKPILAIADEGATADIIRRFKIGAVAPGDDPQAIAGALRGLIENRQRYQLQGGWTEAHTAFDGRSLTGRLAKVLEDCFRRPTTEKSLPDDLLAVRQ